MKLKRFASAVLAGALALSLAACGGAASTSTAASASSAAGSASASAAADGSDLDYIKGKGKLVIGYTVYEPMNYTDADGSFTGFDTELATAVAEKLGVGAGVRGDQLGHQDRGAGRQEHRLHLERHDPDR